MSPEGKRRKLEKEQQTSNSAHNEADPAHAEPDPAHAEPVSAFLDWCVSSGIHLNPKVCISTEGTAAQYGMLARQDLVAGEVVFTIPRTALLSQNTTRIRDLLEKEREDVSSTSGWVPLLISLMYEATHSGSPWAPYLGLWPQLTPPDLPMFWSEEERAELLRGTGVAEAVRKDLENIEEEYERIVVPFIRRHPEAFSLHTHTLDLYRRLVAFVMAYSFQEPLEEEEEEDCGKEVLPPMMVPVADLLNHVSRHNTHLEFGADCLRMVTTEPVGAGRELYNTYGQLGSWQLLHMYGFCEPHPHNIHDTADIAMDLLRDAALQGVASEEERACLWERWAYLCLIEMVGEGAFVFGCDEVLTEEELTSCLKVLCMSAEDFTEYKDGDGWEEDEDDDEPMTYHKVAALPPSWRRILRAAAELAMKTYASDLQSDRLLLQDSAHYGKLSRRQQYALHVRYGQKSILQRLIEVTAGHAPGNSHTHSEVTAGHAPSNSHAFSASS